MAHALPLTKLAGLLIKTLSKPLSKRIKHDFSRFEVTQRFLIGLGQTSHQVTSRMTIWSAGYQVRTIPRLEEEKALKQGAELVGESVVFLVSGGWVVYEYQQSVEKSQAKDDAKRKQAKAERQALQAQLTKLEERIMVLEQAANKEPIPSIRNLNNGIVDVDDDVNKSKSWWSRIW
eukprot:CAMPEP_0172442358 /NCGR_PEP_ID=MMETSP1065-20121228/2814_1 /TAXON_ID=265537 /ORGANISM="Amphiprora paludosa, Strain CCMP125" /LENGTH=175 /DNA_ID=CAMNT_0013192195 /DNA_START=108 /DNA_END=632 /DNA_ORIENTATION=+